MAVIIFLALVGLSKLGVTSLVVYLTFGCVLWLLLFRAGVHPTLAGVLLALTIPIRVTPREPEASPQESPLHALERSLHKPVAFGVVPIFGFANAGVSFSGVSLATLIEPLTLGIAGGLLFGKLVGVFGSLVVLVKSGLVDLPAGASWPQALGISLLCGIGFTMSLFISMLAFADPVMVDRAKYGILIGSLCAGMAGYILLRLSDREDRTDLQR